MPYFIMESLYKYKCIGDICVGDTILFVESVFDRSFSKPSFVGERRIVAKVIGDNFGQLGKPHLITLSVIQSDGCRPLEEGEEIFRKPRTIYRKGARRLPWDDESIRSKKLMERDKNDAEAFYKPPISNNPLNYYSMSKEMFCRLCESCYGPDFNKAKVSKDLGYSNSYISQMLKHLKEGEHIPKKLSIAVLLKARERHKQLGLVIDECSCQ